jgi:CheY-like chemotaxis protein
MLIYIVDADRHFAEYVQTLLGGEVFLDGVSAVTAMAERVPDVVVSAVTLVGPNALAMLHEMRSDETTIGVPVVLLADGELESNLKSYGVVKVLNKAKMVPAELVEAVRRYGH